MLPAYTLKSIQTNQPTDNETLPKRTTKEKPKYSVKNCFKLSRQWGPNAGFQSTCSLASKPRTVWLGGSPTGACPRRWQPHPARDREFRSPGPGRTQAQAPLGHSRGGGSRPVLLNARVVPSVTHSGRSARGRSRGGGQRSRPRLRAPLTARGTLSPHPGGPRGTLRTPTFMNSSLSKQRFSGPRGRFIFFASMTGPAPQARRGGRTRRCHSNTAPASTAPQRQPGTCANRGAEFAHRRDSAPWRAPSAPYRRQ